jgi:hypothetical protein
MKTPKKPEKTISRKSAESGAEKSNIKTVNAKPQPKFDDDDDDFDIPLDDVSGLEDFSRFDDDDDY